MAGIHCVNLLDLVSAVLVPVITAQPLDQLDIPTGTNAVFSVTAIDAVDYQWQTFGVPPVDISTSDPGYIGADTASLTVLAVDLDDTAMYECVVSNKVGTTISDPAQLTVREYIKLPHPNYCKYSL